MNKLNKRLLFVGIIIIIITIFSFIAILELGQLEIKTPIEIQLENLKKDYPDCTSNAAGEWCCFELAVNNKIIEKSCRQFP